MKVYVNDYGYKKGYLENANYVYTREKFDDDTWKTTCLEYKFVRNIPLNNEEAESMKKIQDMGETERDEMMAKFGKVRVTDELRPFVDRVKSDDENRLNGEIKTKKRVSFAVTEPLDTEWYNEQPSKDLSPQERIELDETRDILKKAVKQLKDREQQIIWLMFYEDMSATEIAKTMKLDSSEISRTKKRALKKLRTILGDTDVMLNYAN